MRSRVRAQARRLNCSIRKSVRSGRTRKWRRNSCAHGEEKRNRNGKKAFAEGEEAGIKTGKAVGITQGKNDLLKKSGKKETLKKIIPKNKSQICWKKMSQPLKQLLTNYNS